MSPDIRCVCFDWGGVILRICRGFEEGVARAGLDLRPGTDAPELKRRRHECAHAYQVGQLTREEFLDRVSDAMGGVYSPTEFERIHDAWLIEEYPGVDRLVADLLALPGVETAMLSNTNELHWRRQSPMRDNLPHFPTAGRLKHRHASHLLGLAKPEATIYRAFERETGFAPRSVLFFDDLAENIEAARSCGWNAEQIDHTGDTAAQMRAHLRRYGVLT
ncbi:MAG TPA: HAD-IA family hydrolase [Phycisphaerales bacterium]